MSPPHHKNKHPWHGQRIWPRRKAAVSDPYAAGVDARCRGRSLADNPHAAGTENNRLWSDGWLSVK